MSYPTADRKREARIVNLRLYVALVCCLLLAGGVVARLTYLQVLRHHHYSTLSQDNRVRIIPIAPNRGLIYARDGELLAGNQPSYSLVVIPEQVQDLSATLEQVRSVVDLTEYDLEKFTRSSKQKHRFEAIPLRFNLTEEEVARFSVDKHQFSGFEIVTSLTRYYPHGELFAHVVGYVARIDEEDLKTLDTENYGGTTHIGKNGIEYSYEADLHGRAGYKQVEVNSQGRILRTLEEIPAVAGADLTLGISLPTQQAAAEAMAGKRGAVVAIAPASGEVLTFLSTPGYDPNPFVRGISVPQYAKLRDDPARPLYNRALQALYPPGSTIKPFMALAGLESGTRQTHSSSWCPGFYQLPNHDHRYRCWKKHGHGRVDLFSSIAESCDVYYYDLAYDLKIDRMSSFLDGFGFGKKTGIDLGGEASGINPSRAWKKRARQQVWFPGETLIAGIGQGFHLSTPLQLAQATSILARRGSWLTPHLVSTLRNAAGQTRHLGSTASVRGSLRAEHLSAVIEAMHQVVQGPTGTARRSAEGAEYLYAGKTGTSQVLGISQNEEVKNDQLPEHLRDHGLFIAFAPLAQPRIAIAVIVEHGMSGSGAAAPVARKVIDRYLQSLPPINMVGNHG